MSTVYLSSTFEDLKDHREHVYRALRRLGHDVRAMECYLPTEERPVEKCLADVEKCDIYIGLIAFRRGYEPRDDNPEACSITQLEYRRAKACKKILLIFMLRDTAPWQRKFVDSGEQELRVRAFREELLREHIVGFFDTEQELGELVTAAIVSQRLPLRREANLPTLGSSEVSLRITTPIELPVRPYPLLGPYENPETFAGRDREIDELERRVRQHQLVLCLHAPSGAGKSSLLMAGLAPRLRGQGYPVSVERRPGEPGVAGRLVADLFEGPPRFALSDGHPDLLATFAAWLVHARRLAGKPPVLILDQFDDLLRLPTDLGRDSALARLGPLMAATAQRLPGECGYPCRWVLCYRHEFHGEVDEWLRDVLSQARRVRHQTVETLPYDLSDPTRTHTWPIPLFGTPLPGQDAFKTARRMFLEAIQRPLAQCDARRYRVRFVGDSARRLAGAFARARMRAPTAPLVPELQVVLGHFLDGAKCGGDGMCHVSIPRDPAQLDHQIDEALAAHLRRALESAFPLDRDDPEAARKGRAQALLALRELVDDHGRRGEGRTREELVAAFGACGDSVLETLASPRMRLVIQEERERDHMLVYVLSHDRLAEVVGRFIDTQSARGALDLDHRVVELRRFVAQRSDLYLRAQDDTAVALTPEQHELIRRSAGALLSTEDHRQWWREADSWFRLGRRFVQPQDGFRALVELAQQPEADWRRLVIRLGSVGIDPLLFWRGPWVCPDLAPAPDDVSADNILNVIEHAYRAFIGNSEMVRAMAHGAEEVLRRRQNFGERVRVVREQLGAKPCFRGDIWHLPDERDLGFVEIAAGKFTMGTSVDRDPQAAPHEHPPHLVDLPAFRIGRYPVTVAQFRAFVEAAAFEPGDRECLTGLPEYPVVRVSWFEALAYCEWLTCQLRRWQDTPEWLAKQLIGERDRPAWRVTLPSEAEWEKAARGADQRTYPSGENMSPNLANYSETARGRPNLVGEFPDGLSPYGVSDMSGNVWEWTRSLWGPESKKPEFGYPYRPHDGREDLAADTSIARVLRGGSFLHPAKDMRATHRHRHFPDGHSGTVGFRVVVSPFPSGG